jgi:hypothetical protein
MSLVQRDEDGEHHAGSMLVHRSETRHQMRREAGRLVLAIWERSIAIF